MYLIDSMHDAVIEAFFQAMDEGKIERWMASVAWWNYRQHVGNASEYWSTVAAKLTSELPTADREAIINQLVKSEDALVSAATDWPVRPASLDAYMANWDPQPPAPENEA